MNATDADGVHDPFRKWPPCVGCGSTLRPGASSCPVCGPHAHGRPIMGDAAIREDAGEPTGAAAEIQGGADALLDSSPPYPPLSEALRGLHAKYHPGCAAGFIDAFRPCVWHALATRAAELEAENVRLWDKVHDEDVRNDQLEATIERVRERCIYPITYLAEAHLALLQRERAAILAIATDA